MKVMAAWLPKFKLKKATCVICTSVFLRISNFVLSPRNEEDIMSNKISKWVVKGKYFVAMMILMMGLSVEMHAEAATSAQKESCKQEILDIYYNADTTTHNIYQYKITIDELNEIVTDLKQNEGLVIMSAYQANTCISFTTSGYWVKTITLKNVDANALNRYEKMCVTIEEIMAGIEPEMTDLDKAIYLHDQVVERVTYYYAGQHSFMAGAALGNGSAVCAGYAHAYNLLLNMVGIDTDYVRSASLNHGWSYVELDGEWYHADPTWDDTRSPKSGQVSRTHLLRNDAEFANGHATWTPNTETEGSDSEIYENWFVHNIVGNMRFEDGLWYYFDSSANMIVRASSDGTVKENLYDCSDWGTVSIIDVTDDVITLKEDGVVKTLSTEVEVIPDGSVEVTQPDQDLVSGGIETEEVTLADIDQVDLNDINNWMSGMYHYQNAKYVEYDTRICLKSYVECEASTEYTVDVSNKNHHVLVREVDANGKMLASYDLTDGKSFQTNANTASLAISLYCYSGATMSYDAYEALFASGFQVEIEKSVVEEIVDTDTTDDEANTENTEEDAANTLTDIDTANLNNIDNWMSGMYHYQNAKYVEYATRICLKNHIECDAQAEYAVSISNKNHHVLVREVDANGNMLASHDLADGKTFQTNAGTKYMAISLYGYSGSTMSYEKYAELFANGFNVEIVKTSVEEENVGEESKSEEEVKAEENEETGAAEEQVVSVENIDFRDFANWRTGIYNWTNGKYMTYKERICLNDYVTFEHQIYRVAVSESNYSILIRELDANYNFIKSSNLKNGELFIPGSATKYLAISVYKSDNEHGMSFARYKELFETGFYAELQVNN